MTVEIEKLILIALLTLYFIFRLPGLGSDISNTDAIRWHNRSQDFLQALKAGDLKSTYQHYQPGVTLMWLNAFVKQASFTIQYDILNEPNPKTLENADYYPIIHGFSKLIIILVLACLLVFQFIALRNIYNFHIAAIFSFLMIFEPYLIGMDRWFHLTSLETYFSFSSLLAILLWDKHMKNKYLVLSAIFFALSVLSKLTTIVTIPVFLYIFVRKFYLLRDKKILLFVALYFVTALIIFALLFPAFLIAPMFVLSKLFNAATAAVSENYRNELLTPLNRILFYDLILLLKLSPITVILFILGMFKLRKSVSNNYLIPIILSIFMYYIFLSISDQKIDRYALAMFPSILLICAIYLNSLKPYLQKIVITLIIIFGLTVSYLYYPVYSAYYSPILGGTSGAIKLRLYDNSGEYFAQAALYLNKKDRETKAFVPNGYASFSPFYKGQFSQNVSASDYVVSSLDLTRIQPDNYGCLQLEQSFGSKEKAVVFVFKCNN